MPYVTCTTCRLTTYSAALRWASDECPRCGTRLPPAAAPDHRREIGRVRGRVSDSALAEAAVRVAGRRALAARGSIALWQVEPDLAAHIPPEDAAAAEAALRVPGVALEAGPLVGEDVEGRRGLLLLVSGAVMRLTAVQGRSNAVLLGAGDVIALPASGEPGWVATTFEVQQPGVAAVLGGRFRAALRRWPELGRFVEERLALRAHRSAVHAAICTLPRVEDRVLAALWHAAERWGRVRPDGVFVELDMTHGRLGDMVGARRPTVTLALQQLATDGDVHRVEGGWLLRPGSLDRLTGDGPATEALVTP